MPKRALAEKRPWLLASLAAAILFYLLRDQHLAEPLLLLIKGCAVGLLAIWALLRHAGCDSRMLAMVMGLSALGDMAIEWDLQAGALCFLAAHLAAIALYLRHRRDRTSFSQKAASIALLLIVPAMVWLLSHQAGALVYGLGLGAMAATAWSSSFPRYRVGTGALLYVASDLLIFARMGSLAGDAFANELIWPLYYCGQFLIASGVIGTLRGRAQES